MVNTIITDIRVAIAQLGGRRNKCSRFPSSWAQFAEPAPVLSHEKYARI